MYAENVADDASVTIRTKEIAVALSVLVVEDHASVRRLIETVVGEDARFGPVFAVGTLDHALLVAGQERPQVVVLDADLNGDDGLAGIVALRRLVPDATVVVFSSSPYADERTALAAGADRFVEKGTDLDVLLDVVAAAASESRYVVDLRDLDRSHP